MINKDFEDFFRCLNKNRTEYLMVGGYAHIYYTEPRYTKDLDILINPTEKNSVRVHKSLCEFWGKNALGIQPEHFTKKYPPGTCALGLGNPPNSIEIFTGLPGIDFQTAWKKRKSFKYGKIPVWVISADVLEKNFEAVKKISPELEHKYAYFINELKKWREYEKK